MINELNNKPTSVIIIIFELSNWTRKTCSGIKEYNFSNIYFFQSVKNVDLEKRIVI